MRVKIFSFVLLAALLVTATPVQSAAQATPAFGPKQYTRGRGAPQTFSETFQHCGTGGCRIVVINGNPDGSDRVSSASIMLNGVPIVRPNDLNQRVDTIVKPVVLGENNQLTIRLASKPGSFITVEVECAISAAVLSLGSGGDSLLDPNTLVSAVPIINTGTAAAQNVQLTAITLAGGALLTTPTLPFDVGTISAGSSSVLDAGFSGVFTPLASYVLGVEGTYAVGDATYCFSLDGNLVVPPAAPGSVTLGTVDVGPNTVSGAPFPPEPPDFDDEVNTHLWTVPTAPFEPGGPPPGSTGVMPAPFGDPPAIVFNANSGLGFSSGLISPAEPSGATGGGVIFVSANLRAAYSTDGGSTFTPLNPTSIFPADTVGFCCDQIVQYVPSIDRFVWLLQGKKTGGYRLAVARPADIISSGGTAWTYWNLTPQVFGEPAGTAVDYPDLSVGNNSVYMSWDGNGGLQVVRTSLAGLQAGGTITLEFTHPKDAPMAWGAHLMQDTGDEIFWAGHNSNKNMRVFSLQEGSNTYFWRDVGISSWANNSPLTSNTPDNQNWIDFLMNPTTQNPGGGFPLNAVLGATRVGNQLWFAWSAGTDGNFAQPHIEMVALDRSNNFSKIQQVQVWNPNYAFAYPALATNGCTGEVGMSFEFGGGGNYENHVVGFWGDFVAYITTGSDVGSIRFGDYVTIRQAPPTASDPGNLFAAFGYGINKVPPPGSGTATDVHYVLFGRPSSTCDVIR
jgi:hypothetical protein